MITTLTNTTTVYIFWTEQNDSYPALEYNVYLTRIIGESQLLCDSIVDDRSVISTTDISMEYSGLHEFSNYTVSVTAIVANKSIKAIKNFVTLSSSKYYSKEWT